MTLTVEKDVKVGCTIHFRCGGKALVKKIRDVWPDRAGGYVTLSLKDNDQSLNFIKGSLKNSMTSFLDIIKIEEPPFDWSKVKNGTPVYTPAGQKLGDFVGMHPDSLKNIVVYAYNKNPCFFVYDSNNCRI